MEKIFFRSDAICETLRNGRLVRRVQVILSCRGVWGAQPSCSFPSVAVPPLMDEK